MPKYKKPYMIGITGGEEGKPFVTITNIDPLLEWIENNPKVYRKAPVPEKQAIICLLFLTGARPSEIVSLKVKHIRPAGRNGVAVSFSTLKRGRARRIVLKQLPNTKKYVEIIRKYLDYYVPYNVEEAQEYPLFPHFRSRHQLKRLVWLASEEKFAPYFFRHNIFTIMAKAGASPYQIQYFKGAKKLDSVEPYLHISGKYTEEVSKFINKGLKEESE